MEPQDIYNNLIQSLKLVASPTNIQIESLPNYVNAADEIVLIYNDSYIMIPQLNGIISPHIMEMLDNLDKLFEKMTEDQSLWNIRSLKNNDLWIKSRGLGCLILNELNEKYTRPNLDFIVWVK